MADVVAVVSDLMFSSKIGGTARAVGVDAVVVSTAERLGVALDDDDVRLVMVDMSLADGEAPAAVRRAARHSSRPTIVAFYSHVQSPLKEAAERAGADLVLPRSRFNEQLPELLAQCGTADEHR